MKLSQFILDLFFVSVFILMLILLHQAKGRIFRKNRETYRYTYGGLLALCLSALIQTMGHQGLLSGIPLLSEDIFRNVIEATGIVAGVTLMIAGASFWLPRKNTAERGIDSARTAGLSHEVHQSIYSGSDANDIFTASFERICRQYHFTGFALFRYSSRYDKYICTDCNNLGRELSRSMRNKKFRASAFESRIEEIRKDYDFDYLLPIETAGKIGAVALFLSQNNGELSDEARKELKLVGKEISQKITSIYSSLKSGFYDYCWKSFSRMTRITSDCLNISSGLTQIYSLFYRTLGSEFMTIAVIDTTRARSRRFAVGINGNVLLDNAPLSDVRATHHGEILASGRRLKLDDIDSIDKRPVDSLFLSCGQKSLLSIPIFQSGIITGIVTLGSPRKRHFNRRRELLAGMLCRALATLVVREAGRFSKRKAMTYNDRLFTFSSEIEQHSSLDQTYTAAAETIRAGINAAYVRIDEITSDRTRLVEKASSSLRPYDSNLTESIRIDRKETPSYCRAVLLGEIVELNLDPSTDNNIRAELVRSGLLKMKSSIMIPIKSRGFTTMIITIADMRDKDRTSFDSADITFALNIGKCLADAVKVERLSRTLFKVEGKRTLKVNIPDKVSREIETAVPMETESTSEPDRIRINPGLLESLNRSKLDIARMVEQPDRNPQHETIEG